MVMTPVVAVVLAVMVSLPIAQSLVRLVRGDGLTEAGLLVQHLTLWAGFLGAVLATIGSSHLSLSTVHLLPAGRPRAAAAVFANALTTGILALLTVAAVTLVQKERGDEHRLAFNIPIVWSEAVMPVALAIMTARQAWTSPARWVGRAASLVAIAIALGLGTLPPEAAAHLAVPGALVIIAGFLLGTPVFAAMAGVSLLLYFTNGEPIVGGVNSALQLVRNDKLPGVPLLTLSGYVLAAGGASKRLVRAYRALLGWLPGGMALMALSVTAIFTTFTGASGVTILAMGGVVLPLLLAERYSEDFSIGLVTAGGSLGLLFPPSMPVILYWLVLQTAAPPGTTPPDLKELYIAGAVPGLLIVALVAVYAIFVGVRQRAPRHRFVLREAGGALWEAKWDLALPLLIALLFGTGLATLLETAAVAALYAVIVECVVFRNLHPIRDLPRAMGQAATLVGAVLILLAMAFALNECLLLRGFPDALLDWVQAHIHSQTAFLLMLNALLLVLGSVLEMYSAIVAIAPLVAPLGQAYGVDPVHLGVVFLANLELGFLLPPMGLNLFLAATRFQRPLGRVYKNALPFLAIMSVGVLVVTYVPAVTTGVLQLLHLK
jgi:tripartite ATP-independent transporter DctM subunit